MEDVREENGRRYEITFICTEEDASPVRQMLEKRGAVIAGESSGGRTEKIRLAYPINKQSFGFLGMFSFTMAPEALPPLFGELKFENRLIRYLVNVNTVSAGAEKRQAEDAGRAPIQRRRRIDRKEGPERPEWQQALTNEALEKKIEEILQ